MSRMRVVDTLPLVMFLIFAGFWGGWDVKLGLWLALLPSALVACALLLRRRA